jgi:hypothetical protein
VHKPWSYQVGGLLRIRLLRRWVNKLSLGALNAPSTIIGVNRSTR